MTDYKIAPLTWLRTKFAELNHTHSEYVNPTIIDNLTTDDNTKVLSAKQGKVLKTSLDGKADAGHQHGNILNNGTVTASDNGVYTYVGGLDSMGDFYKINKINATSIIDRTAHTNIGSSADTNQNTINTKIDTVLGGKANSTHNHTVSQITDFPSIPSKTSDLINDSGFLTSHQSLSGYLQTSDVKDNLTSTDTNKPLSANQGKELKALIDNKEDNIYRIVGTGTQIGTLFPNRVELQGTFPFDSVEGKIIVYVVPDISSLSKDLLLDFLGTYPSGSTTKFNIRKSNDASVSIGEIQTGDELLLFYDNYRLRLIGNSSISNKEDKSNKVTSWSSTITNTNYPSEKLVKEYVDGLVGSAITYIVGSDS